jgi:GAF domain-containing protein
MRTHPLSPPASFRELNADPRILGRRLEPPIGEAETAGPAPSLLAAPLTSLNGHDFGSIQVVEKAEGEFTEMDQAMLDHLAQMTSATIDRARLYGKGRSE